MPGGVVEGRARVDGDALGRRASARARNITSSPLSSPSALVPSPQCTDLLIRRPVDGLTRERGDGSECPLAHRTGLARSQTPLRRRLPLARTPEAQRRDKDQEATRAERPLGRARKAVDR